MKISVIMPCYNAERHLERAIGSVLAQGIPDTELIVVDDCSTDETAALAERLGRRCAAFRLMRTATNSGCGGARNVGLACATGEHVAFLDADDAYGEAVFSTVIGDLDAYPWADAIEFGVRLVNLHREVHPQQLTIMTNSLPGNVITRRSFALAVGGFPTAPPFRTKGGGEDVAFRTALRRWGTIGTEARVHFDYTIQRGSHFDRFMDRTRIVGDHVEFDPPDEETAMIDAGLHAHMERLDATMLASVGNPRLHSIQCDIGGRHFAFEVVDRPELIGQATAILMRSEYPVLPFLGPVHTILDVGSNSGASAVHFACNYPAARVVALEPLRRSFVLLRRNARMHPNIESYNAGLFNTTTRLDTLFRPAGEGDAELREQILMAQPDAFFQSLRIGRLDIVRLDNKGCEVPAILAMTGTLRTTKAIFVRYYRDADRRIIDGILSPTHTLYWGRSTRPNHGEFLYVQRALLGPDGTS